MNPTKVLCIIQARLTSKRFPGKVLEKLAGKSLLSRVCAAARGAKGVNKVVVAWAHKFPHLDENDVLGRFKEVADKHNAMTIVRVTSDCPLLTSGMIDCTLVKYFSNRVDYLNSRDLGWLDGYDVQVFDRDVLDDDLRTDKEHVIAPPKKYSVDTWEDLVRLKSFMEIK